MPDAHASHVLARLCRPTFSSAASTTSSLTTSSGLFEDDFDNHSLQTSSTARSNSVRSRRSGGTLRREQRDTASATRGISSRFRRRNNSPRLSISSRDGGEDTAASLSPSQKKSNLSGMEVESHFSTTSSRRSQSRSAHSTNIPRNGKSYSKGQKMTSVTVGPVDEETDYLFDCELPQELGVVEENNEAKQEMYAERSVRSAQSDSVIDNFAETVLTNGISIEGMQSLLDVQDDHSVDNPAETIQVLRQALSSALNSHQSFVATVMEKEKKDQRKRVELRKTVKELENEKKEWSTKKEEVWSGLVLAKKREEDLMDEMRRLRDRIEEAEKAKTGAQISLGVAKAKEKKSRKMATEYAAELGKLQKELLQQGKYSAKDNLVFDLKEEMSSKDSRIKELESQVMLREAQMEATKRELESTNERSDSKEKDMFELMRTIGDIQRAGEARESEANDLRKKAEEKAALTEQMLAAAKEELAAIDVEQRTAQGSMESIKKDLEESEERIKELQDREKLYKSDLNMSGAQLKVEKELRARSEQKEAEERAERVAMSAQMMALTKDHARMEAQLAETNEAMELKWGEKLNEQRKLCESKESEMANSLQTIAGLEGEIETLKESLNKMKGGIIEGDDRMEELGRLNGEIRATKERLRLEEERCIAIEDKYKQKLKDMEEEVRQLQDDRRRLHNEVQELRGNVRVFARIRPFLPGDGVDDDARPCIIQKGENGLKLRQGEDKPWKHNFSFDEVFPATTGQDAVFAKASEFIQSALDGYNVCLFAYGQTGSGKTHTMQGSGVGQMRGIIPRAIEQVGSCKTKLERDGWSYKMEISYLEIYNETIRDLLRGEGCEEVKHEVKVNKDGKRFVSNLTMKPLDPNDADAVEDIMRQAAMRRSVAFTGMNSVSSRSHAVFTLHLSAIHPDEGKALRGQLNLVDLAGSERLERSGATGDRAKEAVSINKSLSALTDVFAAIGRKGGHVPYRNSKLTYLLQPCLSGDGKTLMLVNLSPTEESTQESLCSLRFASQVNQCELGKAKRTIEELPAGNEGVESVKDSQASIAQSRLKGRASKPRIKSAGSPRKASSRADSPTYGDEDASVCSQRSSTSNASYRSSTSNASRISHRSSRSALSSRSTFSSGVNSRVKRTSPRNARY